MAARIEVEQISKGWVFTVKSRNGATVATGPRTYTTKGNARRGAISMIETMKLVLSVSSQGVTWPPDPPELIVP